LNKRPDYPKGGNPASFPPTDNDSKKYKYLPTYYSNAHFYFLLKHPNNEFFICSFMDALSKIMRVFGGLGF